MKPQYVILLVLFCICILGLMTGSVLAQGFGLEKEKTGISDEKANEFFNDCTAKIDPTMDGDSQMNMCACMAVQLQTSMTEQEYKKVEDGTDGPGTKNYTKMLTYVYGPCLEFPVHDYVRTRCLENRRYKGYVKNHKAMCSCLAKNMTTYTRLYAPDILSSTFKNNPYFNDALTPLIHSSDYLREQREQTKDCLNKHSYNKEKWKQ